MISQIGAVPEDKRHNGKMAGFTLIELILVMAILSAVVVVSAPSLSRFFHGQSLGDEARRFIVLTRFALNKAISTGIPMTLWIDTQQNLYGLEVMEGYQMETDDEIVFEPDEEIQIEVYPREATENSIATISFFPDGTIEEDLIQLIRIERKEAQSTDEQQGIDIQKSLIGMEFEILDSTDVRRRWVVP